MLEWDKSLYFVGLDRATTVNVVLPSVTTIRLLLVMYREKANWILTITRHVAGAREKVCRPSPYLNGMRLRLSTPREGRGLLFPLLSACFHYCFNNLTWPYYFCAPPFSHALSSSSSSFSSTAACSAFFDDMLDTWTWPIIIIPPQPPTLTPSPMRIFAFSSNC